MNRFIAWALVAAVMALTMVWGTATPATHANGPLNTMAVDMDPSDGDIDASKTVAIGEQFEVSINVTSPVGDTYDNYQFTLEWDSTYVSYVGGTHLNPDNFFTCAGFTSTASDVFSNCATSDGHQSSYVGQMTKVELQCDADNSLLGATTRLLHLETQGEDSTFGTTTFNPGGVVIATGTTDGEIICEQQADITVKKTDSPDPVVAGADLTYTVVVTNEGPNAANGVLLGDAIPSDKIYQSHELWYDEDGENGADPVQLDCDQTGLGLGYMPIMLHPTTGDFVHNVVFCSLAVEGILSMPSGAVATLTVVVKPSLLSAGKLDVNIAQAGSLGVGAPYYLPETTDPKETQAQGGWESGGSGTPPFNTPGNADCADVQAFLAYLGLDLLSGDSTNLGCEITAIAPALVTITKDDNGGDGDYTTPEQITWDVTVSVGALGSAASGVIIRDDVDASTQDSIVSASISPAGICTNTMDGEPAILHADASGASLADPDVLCVLAVDDDGDTAYDEDPPGDFDGDTDADDDAENGDDEDGPEVNIAAGSSVTMTVKTTVKVTETTSCDNDADVTFADPKTVAADDSVICRPPDAEMAKDPDLANLWLCVDQSDDDLDNDGSTVADDDEDPTCLNDDEGSLDIEEVARNINDLDSPNDDDDQDGFPVSQEWFDSLPPYLQTPELAAQIDHEGDEESECLGAYEFQIKWDHKIFDISIEDESYLGSTGRTVICEITIITENDIRFGCVSIADPGYEYYVYYSTEGGGHLGPCGSGPVTIATIHVTPDDDLYTRLRPSKDNGVIRVLEDENCEFADTLGDPMGGTLPGGLLKTCGDATLTVRMLEGDLDLDCEVSLTDEQMIAYRYGSFFGSLWYQPWFDLEPPLGDYDIDIKDVQFVFGRDGSTCADPYPDQDPQPAPPGY